MVYATIYRGRGPRLLQSFAIWVMITQIKWCQQSPDLSLRRHSLGFVGGAIRRDRVGRSARVSPVDVMEVQTASPAAGYFPGRPELAPDVQAASRKSMLQRLADIPGGLGMEEHTQELQQLREETAVLSQEMRLLIEELRSGGLEKAIRARRRPTTVPQEVKVETANARQEAAQSLTSANEVAADRKAETAESQLSVRFNEVMAEREAGTTGHRIQEAVDALKHLSQEVVARRKAGELPLGQVPNAS
eukprot:TRINITY_DN43967_c0_g1_i1.p1 TRINITY_DN43967_c0_g1~~TRINITY_DN43967_c0_g1_i1.p1  ORF type:complete len:247 (-),score=49.90 TRINITY_DN43967_c0_g1_i1:127-867(-)